jgi:hypothetical protein
VFAHPQRFVCLYTTAVAFFSCIRWINRNDVTPALSAMMFQDGDKVAPTNFSCIPAIALTLNHRFHIKTFSCMFIHRDLYPLYSLITIAP